VEMKKKILTPKNKGHFNVKFNLKRLIKRLYFKDQFFSSIDEALNIHTVFTRFMI